MFFSMVSMNSHGRWLGLYSLGIVFLLLSCSFSIAGCGSAVQEPIVESTISETSAEGLKLEQTIEHIAETDESPVDTTSPDAPTEQERTPKDAGESTEEPTREPTPREVSGEQNAETGHQESAVIPEGAESVAERVPEAGHQEFTQVPESQGPEVVREHPPTGRSLWARSFNARSIEHTAMDAQDNIIITGRFDSSADFGSKTITSSNGRGHFIAKMDGKGNWLWVEPINMKGGLGIMDIVMDAQGSLTIVGHFYASITFGNTTLTSPKPMNSAIFVARIDKNGKWLWAKRTGGQGSHNKGGGIALDKSGGVFITGCFKDTARFGIIQLVEKGRTPKSKGDIFVARLDKNGKWLWATRAGGSLGQTGIYRIATDDKDNAIVSGSFGPSGDFGSTLLTAQGSSSLFVAKIDKNGKWLWAKGIVGRHGRYLRDTHLVDAQGGSVLSGSFSGTLTFGGTTLSTPHSRIRRYFVAKLDKNGKWEWVKSPTNPLIGNITMDRSGVIYMIGSFDRTANFGTTTLTSRGGRDLFVAKLDKNGKWLWVKQAGGSESEGANELVMDKSGGIQICGGFKGNANLGGFILKSKGARDLFVGKLDKHGKWLSAKRAGSKGYEGCNGITVDGKGDTIITGRFEQSADFGSTTLTSKKIYSLFVWKLQLK